jgi:hypothetical protein
VVKDLRKCCRLRLVDGEHIVVYLCWTAKALERVRLMPLRAGLSTREGGKEIVSCCEWCFPNPSEWWMGCYSAVAVAEGVCMMRERWE